MEIRLARQDDALAVETVRVHGWRAAYRQILPPRELDAMLIDPRRWRDRFSDPPGGWTSLVAEEDGRVTGFAIVGPSRDEPRVGELYAIYVDPVAWSGGTGRALISAVASRLIERGGDRLEWSALKWNELALGFYRGLGAQTMDEWVTHRLIGDDLQRLAGNPSRPPG